MPPPTYGVILQERAVLCRVPPLRPPSKTEMYFILFWKRRGEQRGILMGYSPPHPSPKSHLFGGGETTQLAWGRTTQIVCVPMWGFPPNFGVPPPFKFFCSFLFLHRDP